MLKRDLAKNHRKESNSLVPMEQIERLIFVIRGQKVILDQDLAALYGVETKGLNRAIYRNQKRFPEDFAFQLTKEEWNSLRCQIGTSKSERTNLKCQFGTSRSGWGGRRKLPIVFTEHGVVMAANVLRSERAVSVSIDIVRSFVKLRQMLATQKEITKELADLKSFLLEHSHANGREFKRVWSAIEKLSQPLTEKERDQIGFDLS